MKIELYMSCPKCLSEGYNTSHQYWRHIWPCGGVLTLDESAKVSCKKCHRGGRLLDMKLKCEENRHSYKVTTMEGYAAAISTSAHFVNGGGIAWLQNVLINA